MTGETVASPVEEQVSPNRRHRIGASVLASILSVASLSACKTPNDEVHTVPDTVSSSNFFASPSHETRTKTADGPNIINIMTDDMRVDDLKFLPHVRKLIFKEGATFKNSFVNDSFCCPSRATNLTGMYAHNTGIYTNTYPGGGFVEFHERGLEKKSYNVTLHNEGYVTGLFGKYLNEYTRGWLTPKYGMTHDYVPPGWDAWSVPVYGDVYGQYNYVLSENGSYIKKTNTFFGDVLTDQATTFIEDHQTEEIPYMLNLWPFSPHLPQPYAAQDADRFMNLQFPKVPSFNERYIKDKAGYSRSLPLLNKIDIAKLEAKYRDRARSLQSVDRLVKRIVEQLRASGELDETYIIFTSDNGFNEGEHRQMLGKNTPNDESIRVPLAIRGPGIAPGTKVDQLVGNIDIAPTIYDMAGLSPNPQHDGRSLLPLAEGEESTDWRKSFLIVGVSGGHYAAAGGAEEPGTKYEQHHNPPRFDGIVTRRYRYIEYKSNGKTAVELYDIRLDPYEQRNMLARGDHDGLQSKLASMLLSLEGCRGAEACSTD
jgi:arylsulfatase A-like enzyme